MRKVSVGILVFPGFQLIDIAGPKDAFAQVKHLSDGESQYDMHTIGTTRSPVRSSSGLAVIPERTIFDPCPYFDTILIPGGMGVFDVYDDSTLRDWLRDRRSDCRRMVAISNGVFILGAAGLIDRRPVAVHWTYASRLREMFPMVHIYRDQLHVVAGTLYTSAGTTASTDLSLMMIEEDFGKQLATDVARYLVVYLRRAGGQSQFSPLVELQGEVTSQVGVVQAYILSHLDQSHSLHSLAERAHMSARNLSRRFARETGVTPMAYLTDARVDAARRYLEVSHLPIKEIAAQCGFDSAMSLRRSFVKRLFISPQEYRQRFQSEGAGDVLSSESSPSGDAWDAVTPQISPSPQAFQPQDATEWDSGVGYRGVLR